jgi:hypothetical protein
MAGLRDYSGNNNTGTPVGTVLARGPLGLARFVDRATLYGVKSLGQLVETDVPIPIRAVTILRLSQAREAEVPQPMGLSSTLNPYFVIKRGTRSHARGSFRATH